MLSALKKLLEKLSFEELKLGIGKDVCDLVQLLVDDLTPSLLIDMGLKSYGKSLLERKELRSLFLLSKYRDSQDELIKLADDLGINTQDPFELINKIATIPYKNDKKNYKILNILGLNEEYLPDDLSYEELHVEVVESNNNFFELLDYQFDIKTRVVKYFNEIPSARGLLHMPTGTGKTKTAMHIINEYWNMHINMAGLTVWIAHSEELLLQAISTFKNIWSILGKSDVNLIKLWGKHSITENTPKNGIIFCGIQKLQILFKKESEVFKKYFSFASIVIIDEAHKAPAKETYNVINGILKCPLDEIPNRVLLGLTATPGRKSGFEIEDKKLFHLFDGVRISLDLDILNNYTPFSVKDETIISHLQRRGIISNFQREQIDFDPSYLNIAIDKIEKYLNNVQKGRPIPNELLETISKSRERNKIIIDRVLELNRNDFKIMIFACNVYHAKLLNAALIIKNVNAGLITGNTPNYLRRKIIDDFNNNESKTNILINVDVLTTGFDSPKVNCIFIARPLNSIILYSQIIGRGLRGPMLGGSENCLLIEVVDNFNFGPIDWAYNYFNEYWN